MFDKNSEGDWEKGWTTDLQTPPPLQRRGALLRFQDLLENYWKSEVAQYFLKGTQAWVFSAFLAEPNSYSSKGLKHEIFGSAKDKIGSTLAQVAIKFVSRMLIFFWMVVLKLVAISPYVDRAQKIY
jgi:hypothetical protein